MNDLSDKTSRVNEEFRQLINQQYREADRNAGFFILSYFLLGLLISFYYDTWLYAIGIGGSCTVAYLICARWVPGSVISRMAVSVIFALFMFQFTGQMHGMYEMHFFFFINITILLIYQDWRVLVPYTALVVIHHGVLFLLQKNGVNVRNYTVDIDTMTYTIIAFHLGLAAFMALVCGWWAIVLRKRAEADFANKATAARQLMFMNQNLALASEISQGHLSVDYDLDEEDELGKSLLEMRDSLREVAEKDKQEKFKSTGLAEISTVLRDHANDLTELSHQVTSRIVSYLNANQGGLFIIQQDEAEPYLSLMACYAFDRKKYLKRRIALGEGLAGQAVLEREIIYMTEVPADYINITSGLGNANPRSILIVPLKSNDQVVGVIELAAFREFASFEMEFLEKVAESIAASILAVQTNQQTKVLLGQAQENEENLRAQEEEMRQNIEELQATQEEVDRKVREYEALLHEKEEEINRLREAIV